MICEVWWQFGIASFDNYKDTYEIWSWWKNVKNWGNHDQKGWVTFFYLQTDLNYYKSWKKRPRESRTFTLKTRVPIENGNNEHFQADLYSKALLTEHLLDLPQISSLFWRRLDFSNLKPHWAQHTGQKLKTVTVTVYFILWLLVITAHTSNRGGDSFYDF